MKKLLIAAAALTFWASAHAQLLLSFDLNNYELTIDAASSDSITPESFFGSPTLFGFAYQGASLPGASTESASFGISSGLSSTNPFDSATLSVSTDGVNTTIGIFMTWVGTTGGAPTTLQGTGNVVSYAGLSTNLKQALTDLLLFTPPSNPYLMQPLGATGSPAEVVPEPSSFALLAGLAMLGVIGLRRRA